MLRISNILKGKNISLVLGSGGSKGIAHIAVIDFLTSHGIKFNSIVGSSIGAVIGSLYGYGTLNMYNDFLKKLKTNDLFEYFDPVFPKSGLLQGNKIMDLLAKFIPKDVNIEDLSIPLAIVATDFIEGKPVIFTKGNLHDAIRASISIPGVFVPVKYQNTILIDGGVTNPLPIDVARQMGASHIIAINLHPTIKIKRKVKPIMHEKELDIENNSSNDILKYQDADKLDLKSIISKTKNWMNNASKWLGINSSNKRDNIEMPNIFEIMSQTVDIMEYMNTTMMITYNKPDLLIEPDLLHIPTLDFTRYDEIMAEGYKACKRVEKKLKRKFVKKWFFV